MSYGSAQKIAFAGLVVGFLMCATGAIAPFWQQGNLTINKLTDIVGENIPFIGDTKIASAYGGLWMYCFTILDHRECQVYDFEKEDSSNWVVRIACCVNVLLTLICSLAALCRSCCCNGGKTVCHGILAFLAGGAGITTAGLFAAKVEDGFAMKLNLVTYGWAFGIYLVGSVMVVIVSLLLCFASPNNPFTPVIISSVNHMMPNGRYMRMTDQQNLIPSPQHGGQVVYPTVTYPNVQSC